MVHCNKTRKRTSNIFDLHVKKTSILNKLAKIAKKVIVLYFSHKAYVQPRELFIANTTSLNTGHVPSASHFHIRWLSKRLSRNIRLPSRNNMRLASQKVCTDILSEALMIYRQFLKKKDTKKGKTRKIINKKSCDGFKKKLHRRA